MVSDPPPNQVNRFRGELDVLKSYSSFSESSSKLNQKDASLIELVARDFQLTHYLRESISFYLKPLALALTSLNVCRVIRQENLSADCEKLLGILPSGISERKNYQRRESSSTLGKQSVASLKRYLHDDYTCIANLWLKGILSDHQFNSLMLEE